MSSTKAGSVKIDEARQLICHEFARMLNAGILTVRVRVDLVDKEPAEAWFYGHSDDKWHKQALVVKDKALLRAVEEALDTLLSREHAVEWSARRATSADWRDTDLHFHHGKLEQRLGKKLESMLTGILFHDAHSSKKDVRRNIRTPMRGRPRR